jgi:hypothetical protein
MARDPHETRRLAPEAWGIITKILLFFLVISEGAASLLIASLTSRRQNPEASRQAPELVFHSLSAKALKVTFSGVRRDLSFTSCRLSVTYGIEHFSIGEAKQISNRHTSKVYLPS